MKRFKIIAFLSVLVMLATLFAGCGDDSASVRSGGNAAKSSDTEKKEIRHKVHLITMDQGSNFWQLIDAGCKKAAEEMGDIEYKWTAPNNHNAAEQGECIKKAVTEGAEAIVISCVSPTEVNPYIEKAKEAGVKFVYVDSGATVEAVATIETNSYEAGKAAGRTMMQALKERGVKTGTIGLTAMGRTENAEARVKGFAEIFEGTDFKMSEVAYLNNDRQNIRNFVKDHLDYVGFFGSNGQTTFAIGDALKETGARPVFIAFDTADVTLAMIKDNIAYATIQQDPQKMGYEGVKMAVDALDGKVTQNGQMIDTGVHIIRRDKI
ncbi:MAG: substrate-binding domain-containing protein [Selenomonadaceae bacterium]|nr:substrate-binding domain-containing protein [Selenomonadaceae bacterium]